MRVTRSDSTPAHGGRSRRGAGAILARVIPAPRVTLLGIVQSPLALALAVVVLSGCATLTPTPAQQSARAAWDRCPKSANLALDTIDANGLIHYRAVSNHSGARELTECLTSTGPGASSALRLSASP